MSPFNGWETETQARQVTDPAGEGLLHRPEWSRALPLGAPSRPPTLGPNSPSCLPSLPVVSHLPPELQKPHMYNAEPLRRPKGKKNVTISPRLLLRIKHCQYFGVSLSLESGSVNFSLRFSFFSLDVITIAEFSRIHSRHSSPEYTSLGDLGTPENHTQNHVRCVVSSPSFS